MQYSQGRSFLVAFLFAAALFFFISSPSRREDPESAFLPEIGVELVHAGPDLTGTLSGFAWSSTIGWVSFTSQNAGLPQGDLDHPYVVRSDAAGRLSGQAWSPNLGWLSFNRLETGRPPVADIGAGFGRIAQLSGNRLTGWARFLSACTKDAQGRCTGTHPQSEGWDGWVSFNDFTGASRYGVGFDGTVLGGGSFATSVAWGDRVVSWLSFSKEVPNDSVSLVPQGEETPPPPLTPPVGSTLAPPRLSFLTDRAETSTFGTFRIEMNPPVSMTLSYSSSDLPAGVTVTPSFSQNPVTSTTDVRVRFRVCAAAGCTTARGHAIPTKTYTITINGTYNNGEENVTVPFEIPLQINSLVNRVRER